MITPTELFMVGSNENFSFIIPASVTTIKYGSFDSRTAYKLYFYGDSPVISASLSDTTTLYYIEGKYGWTSPTWSPFPGGKAYNTATWIP